MAGTRQELVMRSEKPFGSALLLSTSVSLAADAVKLSGTLPLGLVKLAKTYTECHHLHVPVIHVILG